MNKFKVGDRVAVYGSVEAHPSDGEEVYLRGDKGTVEVADLDDEIHVLLDKGVRFQQDVTVIVHPKQCRKLVKKERRRVWVAPSYLSLNQQCITFTQEGTNKSQIFNTNVVSITPVNYWIEFVEVKKK